MLHSTKIAIARKEYLQPIREECNIIKISLSREVHSRSQLYFPTIEAQLKTKSEITMRCTSEYTLILKVSFRPSMRRVRTKTF